MYYAHTKSLYSVKWRSLYGDTATMQELLLKTYTRLQGGKEYVLKKIITLSEIKRDFPMEFPFFDSKTQIWT